MERPPLTKIIATLGPASSDAAMIRRLIEAGVSIFRLNFSHGTLADHARSVANIRATAEELGQPTAILGDLQGPKVRIGKVASDGVDVQPGQTVIVERGNCIATPEQRQPCFSSTYPGLVDDAEPGQRLLVNDGAVRMLIVDKTPQRLECIVTPGGGGRISSHKGMNLPDSDLKLDSLGARDWEHAEWALAHDLDFLALSFVRRAADIERLKHGLVEKVSRCRDVEVSRPSTPGHLDTSTPPSPAVIAKIELPQAVENIESIIDVADGIMVARGDLGVEMDLARVPVIQKRLLAVAERYGKPCIVATQMLESMIASPTPTRAEVSDVANAIFDGADAVMLSGETSIGKYPALAVEMMRRIAQETEAHLATLPQRPSPPEKLVESRYRTAALAHGVWTIAQDIAAKVIVVWSQQGGGARYLSQNKFCIPIIAVTSDARAARRMQLLRGVTPLRMDRPESVAKFERSMDAWLMEHGWANAGDQSIFVAGGPIGTQGVTNSLAIHAIGDPASGFAGR